MLVPRDHCMDTNVNNSSAPIVPAKRRLFWRMAFWFGSIAVTIGALLLIFGGEKNLGSGIRFVTLGLILSIVTRRKLKSLTGRKEDWITYYDQ